MSIATRIENISNHLENAYNGLQGLGADLTGIDKNIENISMVLDDIYDSMPQVSGEGTSLTLDDTRVGKIKSTLKGNTSQTGTPTPTSPIPVNVVSGDNEINVCGKNLLNLTSDKVVYNYAINYTLEPNKFVGVPTANWARIKAKFSVEPNTDYTFSSDMEIEGASPSTFQFTVETVDAESIYNGNVTLVNGKLIKTFNTGNTSGILISFWGKLGNAGGNITKVTYNNIQLEKGSQASTFESYQSNTYNIDLPEGIELCKIGNYQDYFYKDSGKWYLHKEIGKVVLNGSETVEKIANGKFRAVQSINFGQYGYGTSNQMYSNYFTNKADYATYTTGQGYAWDYKIYFGLETTVTTITEAQTWLTNNTPTFYGILANPTNEEITYQPLINQLNELEKAISYENQTNISQVNNDLPFIIKANALLKISD